jgi:tRNA C32,U32 (ribose-2'-O)-methylase TrmJ
VYELVKKQPAIQDAKEDQETNPAWKSEIDSMRREIDELIDEIQAIKSKSHQSGRKKEESKDYPE